MMASVSNWAGAGSARCLPGQVKLGIELTVGDFDRRAHAALIYIPLGQVEDRVRPAKYPFGFLRTHVDAAMAHGHTEVLMSVRAVQGMSHLGEETGPRDAWEHIA